MAYADQYKDCAWADFDVLEAFMVRALVALEVPRSDAEIVADVLITADKRGIDSHGVGRFKPRHGVTAKRMAVPYRRCCSGNSRRFATD